MKRLFQPSFSTLCKQKNQQPHFCKLLIIRAENGTRTRDLNLGKVALYQLSYFRVYLPFNKVARPSDSRTPKPLFPGPLFSVMQMYDENLIFQILSGKIFHFVRLDSMGGNDFILIVNVLCAMPETWTRPDMYAIKA